jgi:hypothetical protein
MSTAENPLAAADDFATPIYMDGGTSDELGESNHAANSGLPTLDPNDPNLLMYEQESNCEQDPYAAPPPLPDGRWLVKIKSRDVKGQDGQPARYKVVTEKKGVPLNPRDPDPAKRPYAFTALDAVVIDASGKYEGIVLSDYFVSTQPEKKKGGSVKLEWILKQLKVQMPKTYNPRFLLDEFFKAVASEPLIEIDTVWEGSVDQETQDQFKAAGEYTPNVRGQHRFPQDSKGNPIPEMDVETKLGKVHLRAQARISGYYAVGSAKASGIGYGPKGN